MLNKALFSLADYQKAAPGGQLPFEVQFRAAGSGFGEQPSVCLSVHFVWSTKSRKRYFVWSHKSTTCIFCLPSKADKMYILFTSSRNTHFVYPSEFDKMCLLFGLSTLHLHCSHYGSSKGFAYLAPLASAMAASSGDDVPTQLAALLSREILRIRKTDETPPRVSIIDVVMAVTGGSQHDAARSLRRLSDQYPEVGPNWPHLKFKGRGQRDTPVTDARTSST